MKIQFFFCSIDDVMVKSYKITQEVIFVLKHIVFVALVPDLPIFLYFCLFASPSFLVLISNLAA